MMVRGDEEIDPLDAFMATLETEVAKPAIFPANSGAVAKGASGVRLDYLQEEENSEDTEAATDSRAVDPQALNKLTAEELIA